MNLREAAQQALEYIEQHAIIGGIPIRDALRAALAEDAVQRLTDVQQEMERKPLTDKQISLVWKTLCSDDFIVFARAIERAHGIGNEE